MAKKPTFMARVKAYRKLHPRTSQVDAMKKLAGKKSVGSAKKPKKKSIIKTERITTIGKAPRAKTGTPVSRGIAISRKIEGLEVLLKNTTGTQAKNHVKRLINAEYDKLDAVTSKFKSA